MPDEAHAESRSASLIPDSAPSFVRSTTAEIIAGREGFTAGRIAGRRHFPSRHNEFEKRNIASEIPVWETDICIQCGKCVLVCPHSVIRAKLADSAALGGAPQTLKSMQAKWREFGEKRYVLQVAAEDCTGCALCVEVCPAKDKSNVSRKALNMAEQIPLREQEARNWDFFLTLPEVRHTDGVRFNNIKNIQLLQPLFEFSGACSGCGETPYLKLLSQLFGDRTVHHQPPPGTSSIYGGNLPTTPWTSNSEGRGPAWSNSLFEDNAEFGLGMRLTLDMRENHARRRVMELRSRLEFHWLTTC